MSTPAFFRTATALSAAGTLFAGYLSGVKLFSGSCAFSEPCPYFLGYPACWFGFALFLTLLALSLFGLFGKFRATEAARWIVNVSAVGTVFAGSFVVKEVFGWFRYGFTPYGFGLPTCVYGLVFYAALLVLAARELRRPAPKGGAARIDGAGFDG
jgi:uncharacterized membrane protein